MLAWQKVAMVSPQMECETEHLEVWFEERSCAAAVPPGRTATQTQRSGTDVRLRRPRHASRGKLRPGGDPLPRQLIERLHAGRQPSRRRLGRPRVSKRGESINAAPLNGSPTAKNNPNDLFPGAGTGGDPYNLTAGNVRVHMLQFPDGQQPQVDKMLAWDNVQLTQTHGDAADPLVLNGNVLKAHNRSQLDQEMIVLGQPAHVRDRGATSRGAAFASIAPQHGRRRRSGTPAIARAE